MKLVYLVVAAVLLFYLGRSVRRYSHRRPAPRYDCLYW